MKRVIKILFGIYILFLIYVLFLMVFEPEKLELRNMG